MPSGDIRRGQIQPIRQFIADVNIGYSIDRLSWKAGELLAAEQAEGCAVTLCRRRSMCNVLQDHGSLCNLWGNCVTSNPRGIIDIKSSVVLSRPHPRTLSHRLYIGGNLICNISVGTITLEHNRFKVLLA